MLETYTINGVKIAARSYAQAKFAYERVHGKGKAKPYPKER
jgi:hypothetical protein